MCSYWSLHSNAFSLFRNSSPPKFTPFFQILFRALFNKVLIVVPLLHARLHLIIFRPTPYDVQQAGFEAAVVEICRREDHVCRIRLSLTRIRFLPLTSLTHFSDLVLSRINLGINTSFSTFLKFLSLGSPEINAWNIRTHGKKGKWNSNMRIAEWAIFIFYCQRISDFEHEDSVTGRA